jgi:hypothetical protein
LCCKIKEGHIKHVWLIRFTCYCASNILPSLHTYLDMFTISPANVACLLLLLITICIKQSIYAEDTNPITRYFQIGRQVGSCGPEMIWKIYEAIRVSDQKVRLSVILK